MSIVVSFELDKTYGTQNEDVAKKNKYNSVQVTQDIVVNNLEEGQQHDYIAEFSQTTDASNNTYSDNVALKYGDTTQISTNTQRTRIDNFIGQVYYKTYSVTLDLTLSQYSDLLTKTTSPIFDYQFSGTKYDEIFGDIGPTVEDNESEWRAHINGILSQDYFGLSSSGYSSYLDRNLYTVENNIYRKEVDGVTSDFNALNECLESIQNGYDKTQDSNVLNVYNYIKPKITSWNNNGSTITFDLQLPYMLKIMQLYWAKDVRSGYADRYLLGNHYDYYEYTFNSFQIQFYNEYEIIGNETHTYYSGNRVYSANNSFLFSKGNKFLNGLSRIDYAEQFASEIYNNYQNGIQTLEIKYPLGPMYDDMGNQLFYIDRVGIVRKVGDVYYDANGDIISPAENETPSKDICLEEGMKCIVTRNGRPIMKDNGNSDIQYYYIQNTNIIYNGVALNELTLAQSNTEPSDFVVMFDSPENATIRVVGSVSGELSSGARVVKGETLDIYVTANTHYGIPDNKLYVNGQEATYYLDSWGWIVQGNTRIVANVVYLGGKYLFLDIDSDDITMATGLTNGMEIFTNNYLEIAGNVASGLTPRFTIDGVEQQIVPSGNYDFSKIITIGMSDVYVSVKTTSLARTVTVTFDDDDAVRDLSQPFYKIYSSEINPASEQSSVYNNGNVYLEDKVEPYAISLNTGYSISSSTITGLKDVGGHLYEVTDNILASYETQLAQTTCTLYIFNGAISYNWNKYMGYNLYVNRIASKSGGTLGPITAYSGILNGVRYVGYDVFVGDTIQFTIEMLDVDTGLPVIVETTVTATPESGSSIEFNNGETFKTKTIRYDISATIS